MFSYSLQALCVNVHLGCSDSERVVAQEVRFDLQLSFHKPPPACDSDQLSETICYGELSEIIKKTAKYKAFNTVEHLSMQVYKAVRNKIPKDVIVFLRTHKTKPPIDDLLGGAVFEFQEDEP
jgi:dihydroneopterin aldolase